MTISIIDLKHLHAAAKNFLRSAGKHKIFAFYGAMGSGKTTFIKAVCSELGAVDTATSPTFTLVNEYATASNGYLYHFDFYRIKNTSEVFDFGIEEYFAAKSYCFMEWPELIEDILPEETVRVRITVNSDNSRSLEIELPPSL